MSEIKIEGDSRDMFVVLDGVRIAKRQDGQWVSLEPGFTVLDGPEKADGSAELIIEYKGVSSH